MSSRSFTAHLNVEQIGLLRLLLTDNDVPGMRCRRCNTERRGENHECGEDGEDEGVDVDESLMKMTGIGGNQ